MPDLRLMNPKTLAMIDMDVQSLIAGTFDEFTIRRLLLCCRDVLKDLPERCRKEKPDMAIVMDLLLDVADGIAHPHSRTSGPIMRYVRSVDKQMAQAHAKMRDQKVISIDGNDINLMMPPAIVRLEGHRLVTAFYLTISAVFGELDRKAFDPQISDVWLCLLSLLHWSQFEPFDEEDKHLPQAHRRTGYLGLHTNEGRYSLMAVVFNSELEKLYAKEGNRAVDPKSRNTFTVFAGDKVPDGALQLDARNPLLLFAVRNEAGALELMKASLSPVAQALVHPIHQALVDAEAASAPAPDSTDGGKAP